MKKITFFAPLITVTLLLIGCSSTTVVPQAGDFFTVSTTSDGEAKSYNAAVNKAKNVCEQQNANVAIVDQQTVYQGIDKSEQTLVKLANKVLSVGSKSEDVTPPDHNYKTTLTFRCEQ